MGINKYTFQKLALILSIIIVSNLLFNYAIFTIYPSPKYDNFCGMETRQTYETKESCEAIGGEWVGIQGAVRAISPSPGAAVDDPIAPKEYCDTTAACREQYEDARALHNRNVFIALVSLGAISVLAGFFAISVSAVLYGFIYGGLLSFFIGTVRYWSDMHDYTRLVVLIIVLAMLVWIGYRRLGDK